MICPLSLSVGLITFWLRALCPAQHSLGREKTLSPQWFISSAVSSPAIALELSHPSMDQQSSGRASPSLASRPGHLPLNALELLKVTRD